MLPNLLIIGAQKSGTTTFNHVLKQHPEIFSSKRKECHFFDSLYIKGMSWYEKTYFSCINNEKYVMDATPNYMTNSIYMERIYDELGIDIKLIIMLRNPVDRIYSHYMMQYAKGYESKCFIETVKKDIKRKKTKRRYYENGLYGSQLEYIYDLFPGINIKIIWFEDYIKSMSNTADEVWEFLGLSNYNIDESKIKLDKLMKRIPLLVNIVKILRIKDIISFFPIHIRYYLNRYLNKFLRKTNKPLIIEKMTSEERSFLIALYKDDIIKLSKITKKDLSHWLNRN